MTALNPFELCFDCNLGLTSFQNMDIDFAKEKQDNNLDKNFFLLTRNSTKQCIHDMSEGFEPLFEYRL
jgi:hypothetical protein